MKEYTITTLDILTTGDDKIHKIISDKVNWDKCLHVYCRVSSTGQVTGGTSLEGQSNLGTKFGKDKGFTTVIRWLEQGESGDDISRSNNKKIENEDRDTLVVRTVLLQVLGLVKSGKVKHFWIEHLDRLTRSEEVSINIKNQFYTNGVTLYERNTKYDFDTPKDKMMFGIISVFNEYENNIRFEKSINGKIRKLRKNGWIGGVHTFGYRLGNNGKLVVDELTGEWVRKIFKWFGEDKKTINWIKDELTKNGVKTSRGNVVWTGGSVNKILHNTVYIGKMYYTIRGLKGKTEDECEKRGRLFKIEVETDKIVTQELYNEVQDRLSKSKQLVKQQFTANKHFYMLSDILVCGNCGGVIGCRTIESKNESIYFCRTKQKIYRNKNINECLPRQRSINISVTDDLVWYTVLNVWKNSFIIKEEFKKKYLISKKGSLKSTTKGIKEKKTTLTRYEKELVILRERSSKLYKDYMLGNINDTDYNEINKEQQSKVTLKEEQVKQLQTEIVILEKEFVWFDWLNNFESEYSDLVKITDKKKKREFLLNVLDKVEVLWNDKTKEHTLTLHFKLGIYEDTRNKIDNYKFEVIEGKNVVTLSGINTQKMNKLLKESENTHLTNYSTVTDLAKFLG